MVTSPRKAGELLFVGTGEQELRGTAPHERQEHVPLRVPGVALGAEEGVGRLAAGQRRPPFDELVEGAEREADAGTRKKSQPPWRSGGRRQKDLARQRCAGTKPWAKWPSRS